MPSDLVESAVAAVAQRGVAILRFISANDVGETGSHQAGFYLPKEHWKIFASFGPVKGRNDEAFVDVMWNDEVETKSRVKWYGKGTRSEYRLTRFGRDFEYRTPGQIGSLLVLVPRSLRSFQAYVFSAEQDIEDIQAELGTEVRGPSAMFRPTAAPVSEDRCINSAIKRLASECSEFPSTSWFSERTAALLRECISDFELQSPDDVLLQSVEHEFSLFRRVELALVLGDLKKGFSDADLFLHFALSVLNRRKARAGRSLEHHFGTLLRLHGIPHVAQGRIDGRPDIVIPSVDAYRDTSFPLNRVFIVGLKTTCKDRWRQVLREGSRVPTKYIVTLQRGVSAAQLDEMQDAGVRLVVPKGLMGDYPLKKTRMRVLSVAEFLQTVRDALDIRASGVDRPLRPDRPVDGDLLR